MTEELKDAQELALEAAQAKADETNAARTGKGTRLAVGMTRGRNPQVITFEEFDISKTDTLPTSLSEFMDLSKVQDEPMVVSFLIAGYNAESRSVASDPVAEYVDKTWSEDVQKSFRLVVKNFAANNGISIEDAVALLKPVYAGVKK